MAMNWKKNETARRRAYARMNEVSFRKNKMVCTSREEWEAKRLAEKNLAASTTTCTGVQTHA